MISSFRLKFGRTPGAEPEQITATPVTVFVGPNNSGKSKVLTELRHVCDTGQRDASAVILNELQFQGFDSAGAQQAINRVSLRPRSNEALNVDHVLVGGHGERRQVPIGQMTDVLQNPASHINAFCQWFLKYKTLILDGRSRITLVDPQAAGDLQQEPQTSLQVLFRDDGKRHEVRRIVHEAFGYYFVIDPTNLGQFRIRLSNRPPVDDREERGIHEEAVRFHAAAQGIELASDGVKAFTGIVTQVLAGDPSVVLIDEPEAFLHPSLASKLGIELSRAAMASHKRVFVSTHSPNLVMGCIQSGAPVTIVRLTYRGGTATARVLPSPELLELMRNPLLRSTGVLSGLFYEFVVVTESDADRAFYSEINERLLRYKPDWGIPNCLFINAQNKQTIHTIIRPLRKLGIPAAGIVDVDVVKDGGTHWTNLVSGAYIPELSRGPLGSMRAAVNSAMDRTGRDMKRDGGVDILSSTDRQAAQDLFKNLADYGVFVVPVGEVESWLKGLGAHGHGPSWLINVFEAMGEDPDAPSYIRPADDDVWRFLSTVKSWLVNPSRRGIAE